MLGDALFRKSLHGFMDRWHGKHPIPWDFFYRVNDITGRNLNWFWRSWSFSNGYIMDADTTNDTSKTAAAR
jgi:aminopeptidase N